MKTEFLLLACYEKPLIPLEVFCQDVLGIALQTARNRIAQDTFPVPLTYSARQPMVHVSDAAAYIDQQRESVGKPLRGRRGPQLHSVL